MGCLVIIALSLCVICPGVAAGLIGSDLLAKRQPSGHLGCTKQKSLSEARHVVLPVYALLMGAAEAHIRGDAPDYMANLKIATTTVMYDLEDSLNDCPSAISVGLLFRSELILLTLLPLASAETPEKVFREQLKTIEGLIEDAQVLLDLKPSDSRGIAVSQKFLDRVRKLQGVVHRAGLEPWTGKVRDWLQDPWSWDAFSRVGRINLLPLSPTPVDFEVALSGRKAYRGRTPAVVRKAWADVVQSMNIAAGPDRDWWPMQGTLIGFLRYGQIHGSLSDGKVDQVDIDIDLFVALESAKVWLSFCMTVTEELIARGWKGCGHMLQLRYTNETHRLASQGVDLRGRPILYCHYIGEDAGGKGADAILNVNWAVPVVPQGQSSQRDLSGIRPQAEKTIFGNCRKILKRDCDSIPLSTVQDRGGSGDGSIAAQRCPQIVSSRIAPHCRRGSSLQSLQSVSSRDEIRRASLTEEFFCLDRRLGGGCWSASIFFGSWDGSVLPPKLVYPLASCAAFGATTPCPRGALEILKRFNKAEYFKDSSDWPCLALPDVACSKPPKEKGELAWEHDRITTDPRNVRLASEGLSYEDLQILRRHLVKLRARGLLAHNFTGCNYDLCVRSSQKSKSNKANTVP
eukprot:TRINITY_DN51585_c0_g1_i1.p1 TRINITY_DN51585_c0_g1~~TRINITY_DN51585_c0_g1_i1.p1  ORF type:complete len:629 (+),score=55.08 TRINITY_DN51585_c0_g1_i1:140-2026(+)